MLMHSNWVIIFPCIAETCTVHVLHAREWNRKQRRRGENYLEWRRSGSWADSVAEVADGGCCQWLPLLLPAAFYYLCPSPVFIMFFIVYSLVVAVLSVVTGRNGRGDGGGATVALLISLLLRGFLYLSLFLFLLSFPTLQVLLWTTGRTMAARGGSGDGYADSNRWFFLLSHLLFFFLLCFSNLLPPCFCPPLLALCSVSPPLPPVLGSLSFKKFSPPESVVCFSHSSKFLPLQSCNLPLYL